MPTKLRNIQALWDKVREFQWMDDFFSGYRKFQAPRPGIHKSRKIMAWYKLEIYPEATLGDYSEASMYSSVSSRYSSWKQLLDNKGIRYVHSTFEALQAYDCVT